MAKDSIQKRIKFNWQDLTAIVALVAATAGIFVWTLYGLPKDATKDVYLIAKYNNKVIADNLEVIDSSGNKSAYSISFRRELNSGEAYTDTSTGTQKTIGVSFLKAISSFAAYSGYYLIVTDDTEGSIYSKFSSFVGPQVDIRIYDGGFKVTKESSPEHICSNQGFVTRNNYPVVCLPNSMFFWIVSADSQGPDA